MARSELLYLLGSSIAGIVSMVVYLSVAYALDYVFVVQKYNNPYLMSQIVSLAISLLVAYLIHMLTFEVKIRHASDCLTRYLLTQLICYVLVTVLFYVVMRVYQNNRKIKNKSNDDSLELQHQRVANIIIRMATMFVIYAANYGLYRLWVFPPERVSKG